MTKPTRIGYLSDKATQDAIKSLNYKEVYSKGFKQGQEQTLREVEAIIDKSKHMMFSNLINRDDLKQKIQELKQIQGDKK